MKIAVCAICRNEYLYLKEWIAFYQLVGFDSIFIYDNVSDDGTSELLLSLDSAGIINRVFWPRIDGVPPQRAAYSHFIDNFSADYEFILICDMDELLIVPNYNAKSFLMNAISDKPDLGAIAIPWLIFGAGGEEYYKNELIIDRFLKCDDNVSNVVKTLFRPSCVQNMRTHICDLIRGSYLSGDLSQAIWHDVHPHWVTNNNESGAVIYHYYTKSRDEWVKRRSLPKADRAAIEKRHTDEYNLYANQSRVNHKAKVLSAGVSTLIQSMEMELASLASRVNDVRLKIIDINNDWLFGVIDGAYDGVMVLNLIINGVTEFKIKVPSSGKSSASFTYKLKWVSPRVETITLTIIGIGVSKIFKPSQIANSENSFLQFCDYFPAAEEHIFSMFLNLLKNEISPKVIDRVTTLVFNKYPRHKFFIDSILQYVSLGSSEKLRALLTSNPEYKKFIAKTRNIRLISKFVEG